MSRKKYPNGELLAQGQKTFRYLSYHTMFAVNVIAHLFVFWVSTRGSLFPGEDAIKNIVGTCAEIIAGLYGITLAGYTFFLSRIDALSASDMTLDFVVASVKTRFKYLIWAITYNVLITLFVSIALMYISVPEERYMFFYRLFCNEFILTLANAIVLILWYSVRVVDPNCLEKEAEKLKRKISRGPLQQGAVPEFIACCDAIEAACNALLPPAALHQIQENKGKRFEYSIALLQDMGLLDTGLLVEISRIHRYYECMVNCASLSVTREMCALAAAVEQQLTQTAKK